LVVLRWWCDCATMGAMLPLPPALNLNGIDATLTVEVSETLRWLWGAAIILVLSIVSKFGASVVASQGSHNFTLASNHHETLCCSHGL
jgi:hypothetical protein